MSAQQDPSSSQPLLGHEVVGTGATAVVVLHDWMCDTSSWEPARRYLDRARFSWVFTDLRGYGRSRALAGHCTLREAVADVIALADARGYARFIVIGHSMSSLIALHLAQHHGERVRAAVLLTPPPPAGFGADEATLASVRGLALADDETRFGALHQRFGPRLASGFARFRTACWRETADADAASRYAAMFARDGVPEPSKRVAIPVLAITGEHDAEPMRRAAVLGSLSVLCDRLQVVAIADSGHYPMQETPPLLVGQIESFLAQAAG